MTTPNKPESFTAVVESTRTLAQKIADAAADIGPLDHDKENPNPKYTYISADALLAAVGPALTKHGVAIIPSASHAEITTATISTKYGDKPRFDALVFMNFTVTDGETTYTAPWVAMGTDFITPDKALAKALTVGHKYFLFKLFNVATGNQDGEHDQPPKWATAPMNNNDVDETEETHTRETTKPPAKMSDEDSAILSAVRQVGATKDVFTMAFGGGGFSDVKAWMAKEHKTLAEAMAYLAKVKEQNTPPA